MASTDELKQAAGCLSLVFPQFVAKELATLVDQIMTSVQGFTDPLAAIADLNLDSLLSNVASLSQGDITENLVGVAAGLAGQHVKRELSDMLEEMAAENPSVTKRVQAIRNLSGQVASTVSSAMSLFPDIPYAAAQRMCATIIEAADLKLSNLACLRKHIVQLVNAVLVVLKAHNYKDGTLEDLEEASALLKGALTELGRSQRLQNGVVLFDTQAFNRARTAVENTALLLTPDKNGTTVMDAVSILGFGSVEAANITKADRQLTMIVIPSLCFLIEAEVSAIVTQVQVINFYVQQLGGLIANFRSVGQSSQVKEKRARAIRSIQKKLTELVARIDLAIERGSLRAASAEMLLWSSRVKAVLATMDHVRELTLQEGSIEGPDKAFALAQAFDTLLLELTGIADDVTVAGIENPLFLRDQVFQLTKGARRLIKDVEEDRVSANQLATFHALALTTATAQVSRTEKSATVATQQKVACSKFAAIDLKFGERYDQLLDSMRQLGLDRGVDMLNAGAFKEFLDTDISMLSYIGTAIVCLTHGLNGTDDDQTRKQIAAIRDDLIGKRTNLEIASADAADQGRFRFIAKAKAQIATIQKNAKTVEAIVADMKGLLSSAGEALDESIDGLSQFNAMLGNIDQLAVKAGGRLAAGLEEFSEHPNAGVVACDLP